MSEKIIKPFHMFPHNGNHYIINVEEMRAEAIDEEQARILGKFTAESLPSLESSMVENLQIPGLISERETQRKNDTEKEPTPVISIALFLTQACNLKCIYCYGDGGEYGAGGSMEEKTAFQSVDWLIEQSGNAKKINIGFFGGEPFLNFPLMKQVVEYAQKRVKERDKEIDLDVTTNATLLDDEKIAFIKEHNISVMVSFDGPKEIQDVQRPYANGQGSYDSTVPRIKKLLAVLPETPAHAVIVGDTDPLTVKSALQEIGFTVTSIAPASKSLFDLPSEQDSSLKGVWAELEQEAEMWLQYVKNTDNESLHKLRSNGQLYSGLISLLHNRKRHYPCGAGTKSVGVSCSGDVYLCHRFVGMEEYKLGSVFNNNLDMGKYGESPIKYVEKCSQCFAKYYCSGGCKHENTGSCGSAFKPSEDICQLRCRELEMAAYICCMLDREERAFLAEYNIIPPKPCPLDFG